MDYYKKYLKYKTKYLISKKIFIGGNPSSIHIFKKFIHGGTPDSVPKIELSGGNIFCIAAAEMLHKFESDFQNREFQLKVQSYLIDLKKIVFENLDYLQNEVEIGNINSESQSIFEGTIDTIIESLDPGVKRKTEEEDMGRRVRMKKMGGGNTDFLKKKIRNIANKVSDLDFKLVKTGCWQPRDRNGEQIVNTREEAVLFVLARLQFLSGEGLDLSVPFPYTLLGLIVNSNAHKNIRIIKELEVIIFFQPTDPKTYKRIDRYIIQNLYYYLIDKDKVYHTGLIHSQDNNCLGDPYTKIVGSESPERLKTTHYPEPHHIPEPPGSSLRLDLRNINDFYDKLDLPETPKHFNVGDGNYDTNLDEDVDEDNDDKLERILSDSIIKLDKLENYDLYDDDDDDDDATAATDATDHGTLLSDWPTVKTTKATIENELCTIYQTRSTLEDDCKKCIHLTNKDKDITNGAFKRMLINISKYCKVYFQIFNKTKHDSVFFKEKLKDNESVFFKDILKDNESFFNGLTDCYDLIVDCLENKKNEVALKTQYNVICLLLLPMEEEEEESPRMDEEEEEEPPRPYEILKKRIDAIQKLLNDLLEERLDRLSIDTHEKETLHNVAGIVKEIITYTTRYDSKTPDDGKKLINDWFKYIRTSYKEFIENQHDIKGAIEDELNSLTSFTGTLIGNDIKRYGWTGVSFDKKLKDSLKKKWGQNDTFAKGSKLGISIVSTTNCGSVE